MCYTDHAQDIISTDIVSTTRIRSPFMVYASQTRQIPGGYDLYGLDDVDGCGPNDMHDLAHVSCVGPVLHGPAHRIITTSIGSG